jgi:hypothetical protein
VRSAETDYIIATLAAPAVNHRERYQRVSPASVQMERYVVVMFTGLVEVYLFRVMDEAGHRETRTNP